MRRGGFTLIELMVVVAITAILLAMGVPSFQEVAAGARAGALATELKSAFDLARSEAARRGPNAVVALCRSSAPESVSPQCDADAAGGRAANDWAAGWVVFAKRPGNVDPGRIEPGDVLLARQPPAPAGGGRRSRALSDSVLQFYAYAGDAGRAAGSPRLVFTVEHRDPLAAPSNAAIRCVTVNLAGRSAVARPVAPATSC